MAEGAGTYPSIKLPTSQETATLEDVIQVIGQAWDLALPIRYLESEAWIEESARDDTGSKGRAWFEARLTVLQGFS